MLRTYRLDNVVSVTAATMDYVTVSYEEKMTQIYHDVSVSSYGLLFIAVNHRALTDARDP